MIPSPETIKDIAINVLSDFIFVTLTVIFVFCLGFIRKWRLGHFFSLGRRGHITAYLSRLNIPAGASTDAQGRNRNYGGPAAPEYELEALPAAMRTIGTLRGKGGLINKFVNFIAGVEHDAVRFTLSPKRADTIVLGGTTILVGGPGFNELSKKFMRGSSLKMDLGTGTVTQTGSSQSWNMVPGRDIGILERLVDSETGCHVFICAGGNTNGTRGAFQFLFDNWNRLHRRYGDQPFALCITFPHPAIDDSGYAKPRVEYASEPTTISARTLEKVRLKRFTKIP